MDINVNNLVDTGKTLVLALGLKILEAFALWIVGARRRPDDTQKECGSPAWTTSEWPECSNHGDRPA